MILLTTASFVRSEFSSSTCSSRDACLKPKTCSFVINSSIASWWNVAQTIRHQGHSGRPDRRWSDHSLPSTQRASSLRSTEEIPNRAIQVRRRESYSCRLRRRAIAVESAMRRSGSTSCSISLWRAPIFSSSTLASRAPSYEIRW